MKRIFTFFVFVSLLLFSVFVIAQTTLFTEDFDNNTQYSVTLGGEGNDGTADYFQRTDGTNINKSYSSFNGSYFFAGQDIDDGGWTGSASPSELTWSSINISGYSNLQFKGLFASSATNKIDNNDYIHVQYRIDGGNWTNLIWFENDGSTYNTYFLEDIDFDGDGEGTQLTSSFLEVAKSISSTGSLLDLRITVAVNSGDEDFGIDYFRILNIPSNDTDSDVDGPALGSQPDPVLISSLTDTEPEAVRVFDFDVWDYGSPGDGLSTKITQVKIKAGSNNDVDWSTNIAGVKLSTDGGTSFVTIGTPVISASDITIPIISGNLDVPNGNAVTVSLLIYLKTSGLTDNGTLEFMVDDPDHGFTADASGSQFATTFPGATSNEILIDVEASELRYVQQPSDTEVNQTMSPAVTVEATDENGNRDLDFVSDIAITSTGTLSGSPVKSTPSSGLATFSSLVHTATGTGLTLNAERDGTGDWDVASNTFDITAACTNATANINEFHYDNVGDDSNEFVEIYIEDPQPSSSSLSDYTVELYNGNGGGSYDYETLDNFTATAGTGGTFYVWNLPQDGIQNGAPDGIALGGPCGFMEFLSYEGTFTASGGIADGQSSTDVGVSEDSNTPVNSSIQLIGGTWVVTDGSNTKGAENSSTQPLKLLDLSATKINKATLVSWTTSSETNNDYFSLEWSRDGRDFKEIAQIKSKGDHRGNQKYSFTHRNPALGTNYYRLTQYDLDGRSETFNVVSVTFDFDKQDMIIAPNKVKNNLIIEFSKPVENGSLLIYDMEGQMINSSILAKGIDMINLDVSGLPSGQYIVKYLDVKGTATKKFVKI